MALRLREKLGLRSHPLNGSVRTKELQSEPILVHDFIHYKLDLSRDWSCKLDKARRKSLRGANDSAMRNCVAYVNNCQVQERSALVRHVSIEAFAESFQVRVVCNLIGREFRSERHTFKFQLRCRVLAGLKLQEDEAKPCLKGLEVVDKLPKV